MGCEAYLSSIRTESVVRMWKTFSITDRGHFHPTPKAQRTKWQHANLPLYDRPLLMTRCILDFSLWPATCTVVVYHNKKSYWRCLLRTIFQNFLPRICISYIYVQNVLKLPEKILFLIFTFAKFGNRFSYSLVQVFSSRFTFKYYNCHTFLTNKYNSFLTVKKMQVIVLKACYRRQISHFKAGKSTSYHSWKQNTELWLLLGQAWHVLFGKSWIQGGVSPDTFWRAGSSVSIWRWRGILLPWSLPRSMLHH